MKLLPYLSFNGNCAQAIAFYEKVFGVKAESCTWGDMPKFDPNAVVPTGKEKWIMHASMKVFDGFDLQLSDCDEMGKTTGTNVCLQLTYKTAEQCKAVYKALSAGAKILCALAPAFYAPMYGELIDKFGIRWSVMQESK